MRMILIYQLHGLQKQKKEDIEISIHIDIACIVEYIILETTTLKIVLGYVLEVGQDNYQTIALNQKIMIWFLQLLG